MSPRLLVVDDDRDVMRILMYILKEAGFSVMPAYSGEEALQKIDQHPVDLVLTDLSMPGISGVSLTFDIKNNPDTKHIPVIAISAHVWDGMAQSAKAAGCSGFIAKPFDKQAVVDEVRKHLKPPRA